MFQLVPLNITGPTYKSRSRPLSSQETLNLYQEVNEGGEESYTLMPFPGQTLVENTAGIDRGMTQMAEVVYRVVGNRLMKGATNAQFIGTIDGDERCMFANDGVNLFINVHKKVYWWNGSILIRVTDPEVDGAISIGFINNQFIYTKPKITYISSVGDGSTASNLDGIGAESNPDDLVRDYVFDDVIMRFGTRTLERWYNTGVGSPPIERLQGQTQQVGLGATHSVAQTDNAIYFLSDDKLIYQGNSSDAKSITPIGIANEISKLTTYSDAIGYTITFEGQNFYILSFPTEQKTFCLNESLGVNGWFQLSCGLDGKLYCATSAVYNAGKTYLADQTNGNLYTLDINNYTNHGAPIQRRRVTQSINGDIFQQKAKRLQMNRFELLAEMGVGEVVGFENPKVQLETSRDGGKSWKHETWLTLGRLGTTSAKAEWFSNTTFYDMIIRLTITDPVPVFLYSASIELRLAGR